MSSSKEPAAPIAEGQRAVSGTSTPKPETASGSGSAQDAAPKEKAGLVSHGRGGAANINKDDTVYTDGSIVREGPTGDQGDGAFSTGRGGMANIGSPGLTPTHKGDQEIIPETALRDDKYEVYHTGRGGEGNLHNESNTALSKTQNKAEAVQEKIASKAKETNERRRSFFGRAKGEKSSQKVETEKAAKEEKEAKRVEHEKKHPPPSHSGLGDRLKYKLFGKLWD